MDPREVERDTLLTALLDEAAPLRERETLGVVVGQDGLDRVEPALASPPRHGPVEAGAGTTPPVFRQHGHEREDEPRPLRLYRCERGTSDGAVDPGEQINVVAQARPVRPLFGDADPVVGPDRVVDVEPQPLVVLARVGEIRTRQIQAIPWLPYR